MTNPRSERRLVTNPLPDWAEELLNSTTLVACKPNVGATRGDQATNAADNQGTVDDATRAELLALEQRMTESIRALEQRIELATQAHLSRVLLGLDASRRAALRYS